MQVISYGLGAIGTELARRLLERGDEIVGAVDVDPAKVGKDLGEVLGREALGILVSDDVQRVLAGAPGAVAVHATSSRLRDVASQLVEVASAGHDIVSTCEELVFPAVVDEALAGQLDDVARRGGATVVGTGVNPGFLMDSFLLTLTTVCQNVRAVRARRVVNTNHRRIPLQRKVGVGLDEETFRDRAAQGALGHVGLIQSTYLVARGLGWGLTSYEERIEPVLASAPAETGLGLVVEGRVLGQRQVAIGKVSGDVVISLELEMYAGAEGVDEIEIDGSPSVRQSLAGGVNGDVATIAVVSNVAPLLAAAPAGLLTMAELLPLRVFQSA